MVVNVINLLITIQEIYNNFNSEFEKSLKLAPSMAPRNLWMKLMIQIIKSYRKYFPYKMTETVQLLACRIQTKVKYTYIPCMCI